MWSEEKIRKMAEEFIQSEAFADPFWTARPGDDRWNEAVEWAIAVIRERVTELDARYGGNVV